MTKSEALNIINPTEKTKAALKSAYREACKKYHPDHGGDIEMMKLINLAYEILKSLDWSEEDKTEAKNNLNISDEILDRWNKIKGLSGITGEIIGTWIWVSGNTYPHKSTIKDAGFKWAKNKKSWYWHPETYRKTSKKDYSMNEIRSYFGSFNLDGGNLAIA